MATKAAIGEWLEEHRVDTSRLGEEVVIGIGHVQREVRSLVGRLQHPEVVAAAGAELPRGILFHGPAGTGKTLTARRLAAQLGPDVPLFEVASDEVTPDRARGMLGYLGETYTRSVLYLDEIDGFALDRSNQLGSTKTRSVLVAMLAGLDGLTSTRGVVVIGSSNRDPRFLDDALTRAGRLGFHIEFDVPDEEERLQLFAHFAAARATTGRLDLQRLAELSRGVTPADVRQFFDDALGLALADSRTEVDQPDLLEAVRRRGHIAPDVPEMGEERRRLAIHEAGHALVAALLLGPDEVYSVRITPHGGNTSLGADRRSNDAQGTEELRKMLVIGYAGGAAETAFFGSATIGASHDVNRITEVLVALLDAGLDPAFPPLSPSALDTKLSGSLRLQMAEALRIGADTARSEATRLVRDVVPSVDRFARRLAEAEELTGAELQAALAEALEP